MSTICWKRSPG